MALRDTDGKYAFVLYPKREGYARDYFSIVGGGLNAGENEIEALRRECREECGCEISDIKETGTILEFGTDRKEMGEIATCYTANVSGEKGKTDFDVNEASGGARCVWLTLDEAKRNIEAQVPGFSKRRFKLVFKELLCS